MNAIPPDFRPAPRSHGPRPDRDADALLTARWTALAGAARVVAMLADAHDVEAAVRLPVALLQPLGTRRVLIEQGIDDMLAMMEPGLTALIAVQDSGGQTGPAARALWQEFLRARQGLAALAPIRAVIGLV